MSVVTAWGLVGNGEEGPGGWILITQHTHTDGREVVSLTGSVWSCYKSIWVALVWHVPHLAKKFEKPANLYYHIVTPSNA